MRVPGSLRRFTDPILERIPLPIAAGVNRGRWWSLASAGGGYGSGRRGRRQMRLLSALIAPGDIVWDVGAHHGYMSLAAARSAGSHGQIHAFEPVERNRRILGRHLRWNRVSHSHVHPYALSSFEGDAAFGGGTTSRTHGLGAGHATVPVRTAEALVRSGECPAPTFMKIDVEGAEGEVVEGAAAVLPPDACLLIAVHSAEADRKCTSIARALGFELLASRALKDARRGAWRGDPDLLCLGPKRRRPPAGPELLAEAGFTGP